MWLANESYIAGNAATVTLSGLWTCTNGSATISGSGGAANTEVAAGDVLYIHGEYGTVQSATANSITLTAPFVGFNGTLQTLVRYRRHRMMGITSSNTFSFDPDARGSAFGGDLTVSGLLKAGSTPTTLTDSFGKVLSAALNVVQPNVGGTGQSSYTIGDLLYASGSTTLAKLADVATGSILVSGGVGTAPAWSSSPSIAGSLTLSGSGRRFLADMSDSGTLNNRFAFQTNAAAGSPTVVGFIPAAGTSAGAGTSAFRAFNSTDMANSAFAGFLINSSSVQISSTVQGTGGLLAMEFLMGGTRAMQISTGRNVVIGPGSALSTTATDGFLYIPNMSGTPTGVPTTFTGGSAVVYDTSANKLWIYNGSWRSVTLL